MHVMSWPVQCRDHRPCARGAPPEAASGSAPTSSISAAAWLRRAHRPATPRDSRARHDSEPMRTAAWPIRPRRQASAADLLHRPLKVGAFELEIVLNAPGVPLNRLQLFTKLEKGLVGLEHRRAGLVLAWPRALHVEPLYFRSAPPRRPKRPASASWAPCLTHLCCSLPTFVPSAGNTGHLLQNCCICC